MQITAEDRERAKVQPLFLLVHQDFRWTLPVLADDFCARILPELILSSQRDARSILSQPVRPAAYGFFALLSMLRLAMNVARLVCKAAPMRRRLAQWEGVLLDALSGLLVSMARCQRA